MNEWEDYMIKQGIVNKWEQLKMTCVLLGVDYKDIEKVLIEAAKSIQKWGAEKERNSGGDRWYYEREKNKQDNSDISKQFKTRRRNFEKTYARRVCALYRKS